jgi:hypothetical protein
MTTTDPPNFFLPGAEDADAAWLALRRLGEHELGRPLLERRIYGLSFRHNGVGYDARVGEPRHAARYPQVRGNVDYSRSPQRYDDGPEVAAIFEAADDRAFLIFDTGQGMPWSNPQIVGAQDAQGPGTDFSSA